MKLKIYNSETLPKKTGRGPQPRAVIRLSHRISHINKEAANLLNIWTGDKISIAQNEAEPNDWYIYKDPLKGYELRLHTDKASLAFNMAALAQKAMDYFKYDIGEKSIAFQIIDKSIKVEGNLLFLMCHKARFKNPT